MLERHSSDLIRPWQRVEWSSTLAPTECLERLTEIGGPPRAGVSSTKVVTVVVLLGKSVRASFVPTRWWQGRPYFSGMLFRSVRGSRIIGRFNPDPFVVGALVFGVWCSIAFLASLTTLGWEPTWALLYQAVQTVPGAIFGTLLVVVLGLAILRSLHWRNQSSDLAAVIGGACEAPR